MSSLTGSNDTPPANPSKPRVTWYRILTLISVVGFVLSKSVLKFFALQKASVAVEICSGISVIVFVK